MGLTLLFIAHDLSARGARLPTASPVMYLGKIVELAPPETALLLTPSTPTPEPLLSAVPVASADAEEARSRRIILHGDPPSPRRSAERLPFPQLAAQKRSSSAARPSRRWSPWARPEQLAACHFPLTEEEIEAAPSCVRARSNSDPRLARVSAHGRATFLDTSRACSRRFAPATKRALARALSLVPSAGETRPRKLIRDIYPDTGGAYRIGVTGPPGVGKSTLIGGS